MLTSIQLCALVLCATTLVAQSAPALSSPGANVADFDQMWRFVRDHYCCFPQKATRWDKVRSMYRPAAQQARDRRELVRVLELALDELYDAHTHLTVNLSSSWRLPAYDLWAEWDHGRAMVLDVRAGSPAARAGIVPGSEILAVDGEPVATAIRSRMPRTLRRPAPQAEEWALRSVLAGRHDRPRDFLVRDAHAVTRRVVIADGSDSPPEPAVTWKILAGNVGYIRISSFEDDLAIKSFDSALDAVRSTRALIVDVRNNHGGDTAVSRPIMGRFLDKRRQFAWMARRAGKELGKRWPEYVEPRGPWWYPAPVAVLADHFTDSTAEGFAMGMDAMKRATVVGTPMGHLGAATARTTLARSGVTVQVSAEPVYHLNGSPRDAFRPTVEVELAKCARGQDCILDTALALFASDSHSR